MVGPCRVLAPAAYGCPVLLVLALVALVVIVVIALLAVGVVVGRLGPEPERQVFESDEALQFVVAALPDEATAELTFDDVQRIMRLHLDQLHARGVARSGGDLDDGDGPLVIDPDEVVEAICTRGALADFRPSPGHVRDVVNAQLAYFEAIGAIDEVPTPELAQLQLDELTPGGVQQFDGGGEDPTGPR